MSLVFGLDFTSAPSSGRSRAARAKRLMLAEAERSGDVLSVHRLRCLNGDRAGDFSRFEAWLQAPGAWVAGLDFPFGQARGLVEALGWPSSDWAACVGHARQLGKAAFERSLLDFAATMPAGEKQPKRLVDVRAGSISPAMLFYTPVAKMFFEGAPRLLDSGASVPPVRPVDGEARVCLEAYPRLAVDRWSKRVRYKAEGVAEGLEGRRVARQLILEGISGRGDPDVVGAYGVRVELPPEVARACVDDDSGDSIDSVLCALQAAWASSRADWGIPPGVDPLEGWIADPSIDGLTGRAEAGPGRPGVARRGPG